MKNFYLNRNADESGVSGTGRVATGVVLPSGKVVMEWLREPCAIGIYNSIDEVEIIHGHNGRTIVEWIM